LIGSNKDLAAQVVVDKVFFSYNTHSKERVYYDYDLTGALNFDNIVDMQLRVGFYTADDRVKTPEFLIISGPELYTELGIKRLSETEVALTCDLNIEEYLIFLERQERKVKGISEKPLVRIDK
jgi:hypothetical protein